AVFAVFPNISDMRDELLQLMMRFKLCYEIPHKPGNYIAPQLLEIEAPLRGDGVEGGERGEEPLRCGGTRTVVASGVGERSHCVAEEHAPL
ncbi:MAG: COR domain-containing protein, partial [Cyanobacteria bacterium J06635_10]